MPSSYMQASNRILNYFRRHIQEFPGLKKSFFKHRHEIILNHQGKIPALDTKYQEIAYLLGRDGVCVTSLSEIGIASQSNFVKASETIKKKLKKVEQNSKKGSAFILPEISLVTEFPEVFLFGLERQLLAIVEYYLKLPVAYHGMYYHRDIANSKPLKSKLWHKDMEDYRSLKIIIYLSDVIDEDHGPLQYLNTDDSATTSEAFGYKFGYIEDSALREVIPMASWKSCLGATGTVIFIDTARLFHKGKVPSAADRFSIFFDYTSRYPKRPYYCKYSLPQKELERMAVNLDQYQKECLFWREFR